MNSTRRPERNQRVLARLEPGDFAARDEHLEQLVAHAVGPAGGLVVLAKPQAGCSELLRQAYDRLFRERTSKIPVYFEIRRNDATAAGVARRFLREFLAQAVAFRRGDPWIVHSSPSVEEAAELAAPADGPWIDRAVESYRVLASGDGRALVAGCISAPLRAVKAGHELALFIDSMELLAEIDDGEYLFNHFLESFATSPGIAYVLAGRRRAMFARTSLKQLRLDELEFGKAGELIEQTANRLDVAISEQTRDLLAVQMSGVTGRIVSLLSSNAGTSLDSFERVETAYTESLLGGPIGRRLEIELNRAAPEPEIRPSVLRLLTETLDADGSKIPVDYWHRFLKTGTAETRRVLQTLHSAEMINLSGGAAEMDSDDAVVGDFVRAYYRLEIGGEARALVVGDAVAANIRRASALMARHYRKAASIDLRSLVKAFDGSAKPAALFDYAKFKEKYKGLDAASLSAALAADNELIEIPKPNFVAATSAFYPKFDELCERELSAAGLFAGDAGERSIFLAVEIASKLEAQLDVADYWCDRLEMAAVNAGFDNYKLWLIAPEGFDAEASAALTERGVYFSSRRQAETLAAMLRGPAGKAVDADVRYEMTLPMGEDTEIIAAHTLEEIARRHNIEPKAINQIKTALVEALINAAEHSFSPDRKIHQAIAVSPDRIAITVTNRGVRLADRPAMIESTENRRGWGLKLMRNLMDEVRMEPTDDGTSITLIKKLAAQRAEASGAEAGA